MRITVRVKPGSRRGPLVETVGSDLVVYLREPAREGEANAALLTLLTRELGVSRSAVTLATGATARVKLLAIAGDPAALVARLEAACAAR